MKRLSLPLLLLLCLNVLQAQQSEGLDYLRMAPRANVVTYDRAGDIEHLRYVSSSYFYSLDADWTRRGEDGHAVLSQQYFVPKDWKDYRVFFRMTAPAGYGLYVGEQLIGVSHDGAAVTEFDISDQIRYGKSLPLSLRWVGHDGELLEAFSGIYEPDVVEPRECSFLLKPLLNVQDYTIATEYEPKSQMGGYTVDFDLFNIKKKGKCYVEVEVWDPRGRQVDKLGKWCFFDKRSETMQSISSTIAQVQPWNAEDPRLYTLVIRLYDEKMREQDLVGTRFGFRTLGQQGKLTVNGQDITLRGLELSSLPGLSGTTPMDTKVMRNEMVQMKCNNINALRYCGQVPAPEQFYELCDELGFYVVSDAYLSPTSNMGQAVATDGLYRDLFAERVRAMHGRLKNHPCIVAWSLGKSKDNGVCMLSAYNALKQDDSQRPVLYAGAQYSDNTDMIAPLQCTTDMLSQYVTKSQDRGLVMLSFGNTYGNTFGGMAPLWQKVLDHSRIQGGFFAAGSWAALKDKPYLPELKQLFRPFDIKMTSVSADAAEFDVTNLSDFHTLADYRLEYVIYTNLKTDVVSGDVPMALKPGETKEFKLKVPQLNLYAGEELFIKFVLRQRNNTATIPKNMALYSEQFALPSSNVGRYDYVDHQGTAFKIEKDSADIVTISNNNIILTFDGQQGLVTNLNYRGYDLVRGAPTLSFMRTPSINDKDDPNGAKQWYRYDKNTVAREVVATNCRKMDEKTIGIDVMTRYLSGKYGVLFDVRQTYMILSAGDVLISNDITVSEQVKSLARVGMELGVDKQLDSVEWFGRSVESYSDRKAAGNVSQQKKAVNDLVWHYDVALPQHEGNHVETRWASLHNNRVGLYVDIIDTLCNFSVDEFSEELKTVAQQDGCVRMQPHDEWSLHVDYAMAGVGGAASGMNLSDKDLLKSHKYNFVVHLRPYDCEESAAQDFRRVIYPKVVSSITEIPVISKSRDRFDGPMQVKMSCATSGAQIRYTLDGTVPNEKSALYTKPITIQNSVIVKARAFKQGEAPSFVATEQYSFDYVVSCQFAHKPNTPYNQNAGKALIDGELGDVNDLSRGWLGFSGHDVSIDMELGKSISMNGVTLRFAHVPDAWVFAPAEVMVAVSSDGKTYSDYIPATMTFEAALESMNTTQLLVVSIPVEKDNVRFVRIVAKPIARIPQWHRGKGLKPWTMLDEVQIQETIVK